jgi:hypothetical protein
MSASIRYYYYRSVLFNIFSVARTRLDGNISPFASMGASFLMLGAYSWDALQTNYCDKVLKTLKILCLLLLLWTMRFSSFRPYYCADHISADLIHADIIRADLIDADLICALGQHGRFLLASFTNQSILICFNLNHKWTSLWNLKASDFRRLKNNSLV